MYPECRHGSCGEVFFSYCSGDNCSFHLVFWMWQAAILCYRNNQSSWSSALYHLQRAKLGSDKLPTRLAIRQNGMVDTYKVRETFFSKSGCRFHLLPRGISNERKWIFQGINFGLWGNVTKSGKSHTSHSVCLYSLYKWSIVSSLQCVFRVPLQT